MKKTEARIHRILEGSFSAILLVVLLGLGCGPDKSQDRPDATPTASTNPAKTTANPNSLSDNRVLRLDGKTASLRIPDSPSLHSLTNGMTLELWFKAASFYERGGAVNSLLRKNVEAGRENFFLRFRIMGTKPDLEASVGHQLLSVPYKFEPGTWYHLAATCDGGVMTALVNGEVIESRGFTGTIEIDDSDLMLGKGDPDYSMGEYFHGDIDEVRIWNIARSPEQIRAAMSSHLTGKEKGLVAYWPFDDGNAKDLSPNGNNGVLDGDAQIIGATSPFSSQ